MPKGYRYNNGTDDSQKTTLSGSTTRKLTSDETNLDTTTESIFTLPPGITIESLTSIDALTPNVTAETTTPIVPSKNNDTTTITHQMNDTVDATSHKPEIHDDKSVVTTHHPKMHRNHTKIHDDHTEATVSHNAHKMTDENATDAMQSTAATINVGTTVAHENKTKPHEKQTTVPPKRTTIMETKPMPMGPVIESTTPISDKKTNTSHTMTTEKQTIFSESHGKIPDITTPIPPVKIPSDNQKTTSLNNQTTQTPIITKPDDDTTRMILDDKNNTNTFIETTTNGKTIEENSKRPTTRIDTSLEIGNPNLMTTKNHLGTEIPPITKAPSVVNKTNNDTDAIKSSTVTVKPTTNNMLTSPILTIETTTPVSVNIVKCNKTDDCPTNKKCVDQRCITICDEHSSNVNCTKGINPNFH